VILIPESIDLLRIAIFSGVLGFAAFCASYSLLVWRKRNSRNDQQPSRIQRLADVCILLGAIGLLGTWAFTQLEERAGIAGGSDLYVVRAHQDSVAIRLTPQDEVQAGQVIAEFVSPANQRLAQREAHVRSQIAQKEGFVFDLKRSQREIERARSSLLTEWIREKNQIELDVARLLPIRPRDAELEVNKRQLVITSLQSRLHSLEEMYNASDAKLSEQLHDIEDDLAKLGASIKSDETQLSVILERETEAARIESSIAAAETEGFLDKTQMKAPFSGRIVFRHPAPELAAEGAPVLALSSGLGFLAEVRMPLAEIDQLASSPSPVPLALEHPVLHKMITGYFIRAEPLPLEDGQAIAYFECRLPPEVVAGLGNASERVRVRLLWKPSLLSNIKFQASAVLAAFGVFCLMFRYSRSWRLRSFEWRKGLLLRDSSADKRYSVDKDRPYQSIGN